MSELEWETACDTYSRAESVYYALCQYRQAGFLTVAGLAQAEKEFIAAGNAHSEAWDVYSKTTLSEE